MTPAHCRAVMWILCVAAVAPGCASHGNGSDGQGASPPFAAALSLPNITGTQWRCTEIADTNGSLVPVPGEPPTLLIAADDKVSGFAGVNRYFSTATFASVMAPPIPLTFGPVGATRMAGPPDQMELERAFTSMLSRVRFAQVVGAAAAGTGGGTTSADATLILSGDAGVLARFAPAESSP
jgi:heat shock protein HslJ